jgi:hypothetical protein
MPVIASISGAVRVRAAPSENVIVSLPAPPSTVSAPPDSLKSEKSVIEIVSFPSPAEILSIPASPSRVSAPAPPTIMSAPPPPLIVSAPAPPVRLSIPKPAIILSLKAPPVTVMASVAALLLASTESLSPLVRVVG